MNRGSRRGLAVVLCCLVGVGLGAGLAAADSGAAGTAADNESAPTVSVSVDGNAHGEDDYRIVPRDPTLGVEAEAGANTSEEVVVETVSVRVNGDTERVYEPDNRTFAAADEVPLDRGNNTVWVVVEQSDGAITERRVTVAKDDIAPWIGLTSPYESRMEAVVPNGTVEESVVTFGVETSDYAGVERGLIRVDHPNGTDTATINGPGEEFEHELLLGRENNTVRIQLEDRVGNLRIEEFRVEVVDEEAPDMSLDLFPAETTSARVELTGTFSDDVWVRNATMRVEHVDARNRTGIQNYTRQIRDDTPYEFSREGRSVPFEQDVYLRHGRNRINITVYDHDGRATSRTLEVERLHEPPRGEAARPVVRVHENQTTMHDGTVDLVATASDPNWDLEAVSVETANATSGDLVDYERFSDVGDRPSLTLNTSLAAANGSTVVRVRAFDSTGLQTRDSVRLDAATAEDGSPAASTPTNESTPTPTQTATPTATPAQTNGSTPTPTPTESANRTGNGTAAAAGGLPLVGSLGGLGGALGSFLVGVAPFVVGGFTFVVVMYVVLKQVVGRSETSAS